MMCAKVPCGQEHRGQVANTLFPHLLRLAGEGSESVANLMVKANMFLGKPRTIDCHVTDSFSSKAAW